ncbi:MAG: helix-turn-helix transcriptional regulator [Clostridia bacterium]|nr:helix-turn-helix transcriptional regulator [Clostridia bacterium]
MAIGERIRYFRNLKGMTQKFLGVQVGFPEKTADIRLAQYESGTRTPKSDLTEVLANTLGVSTMALNVPDIDTEIGFMHTLFALEDIYGLKINKVDGEICICLDKNRGTSYISLLERFTAWQKESEKYRNGEISKEEYDHWRYTYPEVEVQHTRDALNELRNAKKADQ